MKAIKITKIIITRIMKYEYETQNISSKNNEFKIEIRNFNSK